MGGPGVRLKFAYLLSYRFKSFGRNCSGHSRRPSSGADGKSRASRLLRLVGALRFAVFSLACKNRRPMPRHAKSGAHRRLVSPG
jgi:hypothetical protein